MLNPVSEHVALRCKVWRENKEHILASTDFTYSNAQWLPKKNVRATPLRVNGYRGFAIVLMPAWLRDKKFPATQ